MAEVTLAEIYNPLTFNQTVQEAAIELNAFIASGVMVNDALITQRAVGPGNIGDFPFYFGLVNPSTGNEPNYSTDNSGSNSVPKNIDGSKMIWRKAVMNDSWSTMDLARDLALADPLGAITGRIGKYWAVNSEQRLINSAMGILADNVANDSSDMVVNVYTDAVVVPDGNGIGPNNVIAAKQTMGDHANQLTAIAMHSVIYSQLQAQNVIKTEVDPANQNVSFETYLTYRIVVDDSMPVTTGVTSNQYTSVLFGVGAFGFGQGQPPVPSEMDRIASSGDGGGQDVIHSRETEIIHPMGFEFTSASVAGQTATYAELAAAANWNRVYQNRKNIPMAFLQTAG